MRKISDEMKAFAQTDDFKKQVASEKLNTKDSGRMTQTRRYRLITPLFGGGVKPKEADPIKVIRETSIRGQLRFWWRAMRGVGTLEQMKKREDALFGSGGEKAGQSKVLIFVKNVNKGISEKPFEVVEKVDRRGNVKLKTNEYNDVAPSYAVFPFRPPEKGKYAGMPIDTVTKGVEFTIKISFPNDETTQKDIEATLWAWETFGGIGGRTRRGFGALELLEAKELKSVAPNEIWNDIPSEKWKVEDVLIKIKQKLNDTTYCLAGDWSNNSDTPHLSNNPQISVSPPNHDSFDAWVYLIDKLKKFRQSRKPSPDPNKQGRSNWPEPDQIRRLTKPRGGYAHSPVHPVTKFPRAQFGMPIRFPFPQAKEPPETELMPVQKTRLASPLILRPIACSNGAVGIALILETPPLPDVELGGYGIVTIQLDQPDLTHIKPMKDASLTEIDVLKSFLKTL